MTDRQEFLAGVPLFESLTADELSLVEGVLGDSSWQAGESIFEIGDPGTSLHIVRDGAVEIFSVVGGIEKLFMTARSGHSFGLLSLMDGAGRPGNARAEVSTVALTLEYQALEGLLESDPALGRKILSNAGHILGRRIRMLMDQYRDTVAWNLEVTGLATLNLERLMSESVRLEIHLVQGESVCGTLIRFEASMAGHELYLATDDNQVQVVPYHAVVRIAVDRNDLSSQERS